MKVFLRVCGMVISIAGALLLFAALFPLLLVLFLILLLSGNVASMRRFSPDRFKEAFRSSPVPASEDTIEVEAKTVDLDEAQK